MIFDPWLWLLQANDSAYPSGAYAHSFGLEELVEAGVVVKPADLEQFLTAQVVPSLLTFELPYLALAHAAAIGGDVERLLELDAMLDAWRIPSELRDASRRIGSQRLLLLIQLGDDALVSAIAGRESRAHHLIVTALELRTLPMEHAARALAFQTVAGLAAAAMKLMRLGQTTCQQIVRRSLDRIGPEIDAALSRPLDGWFNPLLEIASLRHARANARLFIS